MNKKLLDFNFESEEEYSFLDTFKVKFPNESIKANPYFFETYLGQKRNNSPEEHYSFIYNQVFPIVNSSIISESENPVDPNSTRIASNKNTLDGSSNKNRTNLENKKKFKLFDIVKIEKKQKSFKEKTLVKIKSKINRINHKLYVHELEKKLIEMKDKIEDNVDKKNKENFEKINKNLFYSIKMLETKEKSIKFYGLRKSKDILKQYEVLQKETLKNLFIRQIDYLIPIKCKIIGEQKYGLKNIFISDSFSDIINKIENNIKNIENLPLNLPIEIKLETEKLKSIYNNIKVVVENYQNIEIDY